MSEFLVIPLVLPVMMEVISGLVGKGKRGQMEVMHVQERILPFQGCTFQKVSSALLRCCKVFSRLINAHEHINCIHPKFDFHQ